MNPLNQAKSLVATLDQARTDLEIFLEPFREQYIEFMSELNPKYHDANDKEADTFKEIDAETFYFEGEEYYEYGEYTTPSVSLPFAFVADPEVYMDNARAVKAAQDAKYVKANEDRAKERVETLRKQLAAAERTLSTAEEQGDEIKATATRNQIASATKV